MTLSYQTVELVKDCQAYGVIAWVTGKRNRLVGNAFCFVFVEAQEGEI